MPATYSTIGMFTSGSASSTSVSFTSIPQTYTDLVLVGNVKFTTSSDLYITFNNDTSTNYSRTRLINNSLNTVSSTTTKDLAYYVAGAAEGTSTSGFATFTMHINNYKGNINKPLISQMGTPNNTVFLTSGAWRSTSAISTITLTTESGYIATSTTFTLYGIAAV